MFLMCFIDYLKEREITIFLLGDNCFKCEHSQLRPY